MPLFLHTRTALPVLGSVMLAVGCANPDMNVSLTLLDLRTFLP